MTTNTAFIEKREELKRRLAAGEYKTLVDVVLDWVDRLLRKIIRRLNPIPLWSITIILSLASTLLVVIALYVAGELLPTHIAFTQLGFTLGLGVLWLLLINALNITDMIVINYYIHRIFTFWCENILDATRSENSLERFNSWLNITCNRKLHLQVTLIGGILLSLFMMIASALRGILFGYGSAFGALIACLIVSATVYLFWLAILLSALLYRYDLKLFPADPSNSELMSRLSGELGFLIYVVAFSGAVGALITALAGELFQILGIAQILIIWLPLIVIFILNQSSLSSIIRRVKWKTLNEIQMKVEKLQTSKNFGNQESMDAIKRLMDYHDRVKATRDSALDFRTYLSFFNSLLLPLLAFLLGNLDLVLKLFGIKP